MQQVADGEGRQPTWKKGKSTIMSWAAKSWTSRMKHVSSESEGTGWNRLWKSLHDEPLSLLHLVQIIIEDMWHRGWFCMLQDLFGIGVNTACPWGSGVNNANRVYESHKKNPNRERKYELFMGWSVIKKQLLRQWIKIQYKMTVTQTNSGKMLWSGFIKLEFKHAYQWTAKWLQAAAQR